MHKLYCFGFNVFGQAGSETEAILSSACIHKDIKTVLYAGWEVTIGIGYNDLLFAWGLKSALIERLMELCKATVPHSIFGDPDTVMGFIDNHEILTLITPTLECSFEAISHAAYSQHYVYMLNKQKQVKRLNCQSLDCVDFEALILPPVNAIFASNQHILFLTDSLDVPVYGLGSNKLCQLGILEEQYIDQPVAIEYFCGLMAKAEHASCGLFHSAVVLNGDVYTFGWSKDGRLGTGNYDKEEVVSLAQYKDELDQPVEVYAIQVSCGSAHTLVLDDQGQIWSCGSNKYKQLGRKGVSDDHYFRKIEYISKAVSCFAGRWTTFVHTL